MNTTRRAAATLSPGHVLTLDGGRTWHAITSAHRPTATRVLLTFRGGRAATFHPNDTVQIRR